MKPKIPFELYQWIYFVLFWLIGMVLCMALIEFFAGPTLQWLLYSTPYQLPTWNRVGHIGLVVLFTGFFAGTISWYHEKRSSGR